MNNPPRRSLGIYAVQTPSPRFQAAANSRHHPLARPTETHRLHLFVQIRADHHPSCPLPGTDGPAEFCSLVAVQSCPYREAIPASPSRHRAANRGTRYNSWGATTKPHSEPTTHVRSAITSRAASFGSTGPSTVSSSYTYCETVPQWSPKQHEIPQPKVRMS